MDYKHTIFTVLLGLIITANPLQAGPRVQSEVVEFALEEVIDGLGIPWGMAFISDTVMLVTERDGKISLLDTRVSRITPLQGVPRVKADGQGGMLDVAVPPDFKPGDRIYFTFVRDREGDGVTVLARAKLRGEQLVEWQDLLETRSATGSGQHFGSRIACDEHNNV